MSSLLNGKKPFWTSTTPSEARTLLHCAHGRYSLSPSEKALSLVVIALAYPVVTGIVFLLSANWLRLPALPIVLCAAGIGTTLGLRAGFRERNLLVEVSRTAIVQRYPASAPNVISMEAFGSLGLVRSRWFAGLVVTSNGHRQSLRVPLALIERLDHSLPTFTVTGDAQDTVPPKGA